MKKNKKVTWKSQLPKFWKTAVRYRKLLIWLGISIFTLVIVGGAFQPIFFPILHSSDILLPEESFRTSIIYIENVKTGYYNPDPSYPSEVNNYLEKSMAYKLGFEKSNNKKIISKEIFPVTANGKDRFLLIGRSTDENDRYNYIYKTFLSLFRQSLHD
jgi:hypothetical protein